MAAGRTARVEAFSLTHAQILDGSTSFVDTLSTVAADDLDVFGVNDGSVKPQMDDWQNEGDDDIMSDWSWLKWADVDVQGGYISMPLWARLSNQSVSSSGSGDTLVYGVDLWDDASMNVAPTPFLMLCPSRDEDGKPCRLVIGLYKVQWKPIAFDGPKYKDGLKVNYAGKALKSAKDEMGNPFPGGGKKVGKLLSIL